MKKIKERLEKDFNQHFDNSLDFSQIKDKIEYKSITINKRFSWKSFIGGLSTGLAIFLLIVIAIPKTPYNNKNSINDGNEEPIVNETSKEFLSYQSVLTKSASDNKENELLANFAYSNGFINSDPSTNKVLKPSYVITINFKKGDYSTFKDYVKQYDDTPFTNIATKLGLQDIAHYMTYHESEGFITITYNQADKVIISQYMIDILSTVELPYIDKIDFQIYQEVK